jgi:hypothetical protein
MLLAIVFALLLRMRGPISGLIFASVSLAAQAPMLGLVAAYHLLGPVVERHFPHYVFDASSRNIIVAVTFAAALGASTGPGLSRLVLRLKWIDRIAGRAWWAVMVGGTVLVVGAAVRHLAAPSSEDFVRSLPLVLTLPAIDARSCHATRTLSPGHDLGTARECVEEEARAGDLRIHRHCSLGGIGSCRMMFRPNGGLEKEGWRVSPSEPIEVRRDEIGRQWIVGNSGAPRVVGDRVSWLTFDDLRGRAAPRSTWTGLAAIGLLIGAALGGVGWAGQRARGASNAGRALLGAWRLAGAAVALLALAPLVTAAIRGLV